MIPYSDVNPTWRFAVVNYLLLALNIAAFVYELSLGQNGLNELVRAWGVRSNEVTSLLGGELGLLPRVLLTSFVSMFLHGGWLHIIGNMLSLWIFGDNVEDNFGHLRYLLFYLLSGYAAVLGQAWLTPLSDTPAIGASGAISGVMAAYLLLYPSALVKAIIPIFFFITFARVPAWLVIILWFVLQVFNGAASITSAATMTGGVAYGAHVGGFVAGFVLALLLRRPTVRPRYGAYQ